MRNSKTVKSLESSTEPDVLPAEHLDLILQEADRALIIVDSRIDDPGRRVLDGLGLEEMGATRSFAELNLALAELSDACPCLGADIELVSERMRTKGAASGAAEFARHHHLVDLVRLSLESLFCVYRDPVSFASARLDIDDDCDLHTATEMYEQYRSILDLLRRTLN